MKAFCGIPTVSTLRAPVKLNASPSKQLILQLPMLLGVGVKGKCHSNAVGCQNEAGQTIRERVRAEPWQGAGRKAHHATPGLIHACITVTHHTRTHLTALETHECWLPLPKPHPRHRKHLNVHRADMVLKKWPEPSTIQKLMAALPPMQTKQALGNQTCNAYIAVTFSCSTSLRSLIDL